MGMGESHTLHLLVSALIRICFDQNDNLLVSKSLKIVIR